MVGSFCESFHQLRARIWRFYLLIKHVWVNLSPFHAIKFDAIR